MKFTGHERDLGVLGSNVDDLDYMHARYYRPLVGQFLSVDRLDVPKLQIDGSSRFQEVLRQPDSWNRFAYAKGNPGKYWDPDGESWELALASGGSLSTGATETGTIAFTGAAPVVVATGLGLGLGYAVNQIPGVNEALTIRPLSEAISNLVFASASQAVETFIT